MATLTATVRRARTIGRLALVVATVATAGSDTASTPATASPNAAAAPADGALRASGYMLSSGRDAS